jgi:hypothetical protein
MNTLSPLLEIKHDRIDPTVPGAIVTNGRP